MQRLLRKQIYRVSLPGRGMGREIITGRVHQGIHQAPPRHRLPT